MKMVLAVIGYGWALIGAANIVLAFTDEGVAPESGFAVLVLILNMVLFVLPGLMVGAMGSRKAS